MAYIPEKHLKYNLLPRCQDKGGEVFSYPMDMIDILLEIPNIENIIPYGYNTYDEYYLYLDELIEKYKNSNSKISNLLNELKSQIIKMNIKENWSVLKYVGESTDGIFGLTKGQFYYWPCSVESPMFEGVIDDEEFTSYLYSTKSELWEIAEDPLDMAKKHMK